MINYNVFSLIPFFKGIIIIVLLNDYLKRKFPQNYKIFENKLVSYTYNLIYIYSKGQIMYNKLYFKIKNVILSNPYLKEIINTINKSRTNYELEYINNGNVIAKYNINLSDITDISDNSFCIFSDLNNEEINNSRINKKIIHNFPITKNYEISNISFILFEVKIGDKKYKINLKDDKCNYYLVDNIIDKKFVIYYLMNYINENLSYENINSEQIIVNLIDNNVEMKDIDMTNGKKCIIIKKDNYLINEQ